MILSFDPASTGSLPAALALGSAAVVALVAYLVAALPGERADRWQRWALLVGWVAHGAMLAIDIAGIGSPVAGARFGFAPALSITVWLVLAVYELETRFMPLRGAGRTLAVCAIVVVALAVAFPGAVYAQVASAWAPLHWLLGIASYGLFGVAVLHAALQSRAERRMRHTSLAASGPQGVPLRLERLTFRFVLAGFIVLTAAIVLGVGSGGAWHWDHKTVFSLLGWAVFAALLVGRRAFGWRGPMAARWLYAGAGLLLLAYVGSRFVLEVLLHRAPMLAA